MALLAILGAAVFGPFCTKLETSFFRFILICRGSLDEGGVVGFVIWLWLLTFRGVFEV